MILVDSAVCAAMKRDVKAGGYTVFGIELEGDAWIGIEGSGWTVLAEAGSMPRKILGLIVEHAGGLPGIGQAWLLQKPRKGDIQRQDAMFTMIREEIGGLLGTQWGSVKRMARMPLTLDGYELWQDREDLSVVQVAPELADLADWNGMAARDGETLAKSGLFSWCFIRKQPDDATHQVWMRHLSQMAWI